MRSGIGKQMKEKFKLSYDLTCNWWHRSDLEAIPVNIERVAEILRHAEIEVYEVGRAGNTMIQRYLFNLKTGTTITRQGCRVKVLCALALSLGWLVVCMWSTGNIIRLQIRD
jgi:hypothetical protein